MDILAIQPGRGRSSPPLAQAIRLLLVEDNPGDVLLIRESLKESRSASFELIHHATLAASLAYLASADVDAILLDLALPDSFGPATLEKLLLAAPDVPIIVLTELDDDQLAVQAVHSGAQDYLIKRQLSSYLLVRSVQHAIERKQLESALRKSLELYDLASKASSDLTIDWDVTTNTVALSQAAKTHYGYHLEPPLSIAWWRERIHPEDEARVMETLWAAIANEDSLWEAEYRFRRADGVYLHVFDRSIIVRNAIGKTVRVVCSLVDISKLKQAELALAKANQEALLMAKRMQAVAGAAAGILSARSYGELQGVIQEACRSVVSFDFFSFGLYDEQAHALKFLEGYDDGIFLPPELIPLAGMPSEQVVLQKRSLLSKTSDDPAVANAKVIGTGKRSESTVRVPILDDHKVLGVLSVQSYTPELYSEQDLEVFETLAAVAATAIKNIQYLQQRQEAEMAVRQSEARLQKLFDETPSFIAIAQGPDHVFTTANAVYLQAIGKEDIIGKPVRDVLPEIEGQGVIEILDRVYQTGESFIGNEMLIQLNRTKDAAPEPRYFDLIYQAIKDAEGNPVGVMAHGLDITEQVLARKEIEAKAKEVERLNRDLAEHLKRAQALHSIDLAITATMGLELPLNAVIEQAISLLNVDAANVLIYKPQSQQLEHTVNKGFKTKEIRRCRLRIGEGLAGRAALERKLVHVESLQVHAARFSHSDFLALEGFKSYIGLPLIAKGELKGVLEVWQRSVLAPDKDWFAFLEALALQAAIAIDNITMFENLQRSNINLALAYDATIEGWSKALDLKDHETEGHSRRVTDLTLELARLMGMGEEELMHVRRGALLHDIGKMGVPDSILLKPGKLTDDEWVTMKKHPQYAHDLLFPISFLRPALDIPLYHHEKWDGSGYPKGLKGEQIPLAARIFAVVDVYDALTSDRPYRKAWPKEQALAHIKEQAGSHFDPRVVVHLLALMADPLRAAGPVRAFEPVLVRRSG